MTNPSSGSRYAYWPGGSRRGPVPCTAVPAGSRPEHSARRARWEDSKESAASPRLTRKQAEAATDCAVALLVPATSSASRAVKRKGPGTTTVNSNGRERCIGPAESDRSVDTTHDSEWPAGTAPTSPVGVSRVLPRAAAPRPGTSRQPPAGLFRRHNSRTC